ncbi:MAG: hypothetical protein AAF697_13085 [Pseudomonadota bacterium]
MSILDEHMAALLAKGYAGMDYEGHFAAYGIGAPYIDQKVLDSPPPVKSGLITIPQAIALIGAEQFGEEWKEWERGTLHFPQPVLKPLETKESLRKMDNALAPKPVPKSISFAASGRGTRRNQQPSASAPSYEQRLADWQAGAEARKAEIKAKLARVSELHEEWKNGAKPDSIHTVGVANIKAVFRNLVRAISDGEVHPILQPLDGQKAHSLDAEHFLVEGNQESAIRFSAAYAVSNVTETLMRTGCIFVPEAEVRSALGASRNPAGGLEGLHLSPFMQILLDVIKESRISPDNQVKTIALKQMIKDAAERRGIEYGEGKALSERNIGVMATLMREPPKK